MLLSKYLVYVAEQGSIWRVRFLLKIGANPNTKDLDNYTPLLYAAAYGYTKIVQLLLEKKADVNIANR